MRSNLGKEVLDFTELTLPERFGGEGGEAVSLAISSSLEVIDPIPDEVLDVVLEEDISFDVSMFFSDFDEIITAPEDVLGLATCSDLSKLVEFSGSQTLLSLSEFASTG